MILYVYSYFVYLLHLIYSPFSLLPPPAVRQRLAAPHHAPDLPAARRAEAEPEDRVRYQTVYAKHIGAVAAPSAGIHFTQQLMKRMEIKGVEMPAITLHVGLGSFRPVDVEDLTKHKMDSENFRIYEETAVIVNKALDEKKRVCAVGTTAMRSIESSVSASNRLKATEAWTDKFIFPPYEFKIANALLTNFHTPESTLLMMACAFGGFDLIMKAYQEAMKENYRFLSYGDAMLII